jgi:myo-inositol-1(or 4)-monophosphatase
VTDPVKAGQDVATETDLDAERAIMDVIARAPVDDARLGEETGAAGRAGRRRWLVDPLCGTLNFAAQTPPLAVNVAPIDGTRSSRRAASWPQTAPRTTPGPHCGAHLERAIRDTKDHRTRS